MHKKEIFKLASKVEVKGLTLVPVKAYFRNGFVKLDVALARGKNAPDKRNAIKEREQKIEAGRALKYSKN